MALSQLCVVEAQLAERTAFRQCVLLVVLLVERLITAFLTKLAFTFRTLMTLDETVNRAKMSLEVPRSLEF